MHLLILEVCVWICFALQITQDIVIIFKTIYNFSKIKNQSEKADWETEVTERLLGTSHRIDEKEVDTIVLSSAQIQTRLVL